MVRLVVRVSVEGGRLSALHQGREILLDDSGLGISLADRLREFLPGEEPCCDLVVEGTWGPLVGMPGFLPGEEKGRPVFAVRSVLGRPGEEGA